jgi:hypothetical protein
VTGTADRPKAHINFSLHTLASMCKGKLPKLRRGADSQAVCVPAEFRYKTGEDAPTRVRQENEAGLNQGQWSGSQVQHEAEPTELADCVLAPKQKCALADLIALCDSKAATPEGLALWECAKLAGQELG